LKKTILFIDPSKAIRHQIMAHRIGHCQASDFQLQLASYEGVIYPWGDFAEFQCAGEPAGQRIGHGMTGRAHLRAVPDRGAIIVSAEERRRSPRLAAITGYLDQLPDVALLSRLQMPVLAVARDGVIVFANPACQIMLGDPDVTIAGRRLNHFLLAAETADGVAMLRAAAGQLTTWQGAHDQIVRAVVSQPLLVHAQSPLLFVGLTDVTEWAWDVGLSSADAPINPCYSRSSQQAQGMSVRRSQGRGR
jgi:PAS domain-containing protein